MTGTIYVNAAYVIAIGVTVISAVLANVRCGRAERRLAAADTQRDKR
jgi:uncharacterized membrane protein (DUF485 family)